MTRFFIFVILACAIVALFARSQRARRILWGIALALAAYAVLKALGVIEMLAPDRTGVF